MTRYRCLIVFFLLILSSGYEYFGVDFDFDFDFVFLWIFRVKMDVQCHGILELHQQMMELNFFILMI